MILTLPAHSTTVSPSTGLQPSTVAGSKVRTIPPRPRTKDTNSGTQLAEYPTAEQSGALIEASGASGWEGFIDRAIPVERRVLSDNWTAIGEGSRENVVAPQGNTE
jgi:hypothetical protein